MADQPTLQFLGAAGTVTGSMHLVTAGGSRVLLDCGLYQGLKDLRQRNWGTRLVDPGTVRAIVMSHAHIDHSGYLPLVVQQGFRGPIYCTAATADILGVVLPDAAHLQEEDAERANRHGYTRHRPALPLYTSADAAAALKLLQTRRYETAFPVAPGITALYRRAGHIMGSATIELSLAGPPPSTLVFTGDLGRYDRPILLDPEPVPAADVLLLESTYGDRAHPAGDDQELARIVNDTAKRGGALLIPAFAVDRTQELLWMLRRLEDQKKIPVLPVYVDSPMANAVTGIYEKHPEEFDADMRAEARTGDPLETRRCTMVSSTEESKKLNGVRGPVIIISSSGMASGGRILHHLALRLPDPRTTVLLVGYQAAGTRGRTLQDGGKTVRIFGQEVTIAARVESLHGLSGHADRDEIVRWLGGFTRPPKVTYLVHGEGESAKSLAAYLTQKLRWTVKVAADGETVPLRV
ncbi:MAG TPA: MBL fold metallo-hydrolase [Gemmatimonadales bacterium]|nr:MBL fold metallo-hydrolase [Gemmatimonadales bacterium]